MRKLRQNAYLARKTLRHGQRLARKVNNDDMPYDSLSRREQVLVDELHARELHVRVDQANILYGHGIARTHDFGFQAGENMCRDVPIEVRAQLRTLQGS